MGCGGCGASEGCFGCGLSGRWRGWGLGPLMMDGLEEVGIFGISSKRFVRQEERAFEGGHESGGQRRALRRYIVERNGCRCSGAPGGDGRCLGPYGPSYSFDAPSAAFGTNCVITSGDFCNASRDDFMGHLYGVMGGPEGGARASSGGTVCSVDIARTKSERATSISRRMRWRVWWRAVAIWRRVLPSIQ